MKRYRDAGVSPLRTTQRGGGTNCTGTTKNVKWDGKRSETWFDSCDTNLLIQKWSTCGIAVGLATFAAPGYWASSR